MLKNVITNVITFVFITLPMASALNCIFAKKEVQLTENPKSTCTQSNNDSMVETQKRKETKSMEGAVPVKADTTKVFDKETEKKIEDYISELISTDRITLPKDDAWMAQVIRERLNPNPKDGYYYFVSIHGPDKDGNVEIYFGGKMKF